MPENTSQASAFGCLYVLGGMEAQTAALLEMVIPDLRAFAVRRIKHKQQNGVRSLETELLLHGYVIFSCPADFPTEELHRFKNVRRLLRYEDKDWRLRGEDLTFAEWIAGLNGEIGLSQAVQEGTEIRIISGPLKDCEGRILKIDKHRRSCLVSLGFDRQLLKTWLAFDWFVPTQRKLVL